MWLVSMPDSTIYSPIVPTMFWHSGAFFWKMFLNRVASPNLICSNKTLIIKCLFSIRYLLDKISGFIPRNNGPSFIEKICAHNPNSSEARFLKTSDTKNFVETLLYSEFSHKMLSKLRLREKLPKVVLWVMTKTKSLFLEAEK